MINRLRLNDVMTIETKLASWMRNDVCVVVCSICRMYLYLQMIQNEEIDIKKFYDGIMAALIIIKTDYKLVS